MRKTDNLPSSCAIVTKSGKLNFLEHSGPVQACNGTALPLHFNHAEIVRQNTNVFLCHKQAPEDTGSIIDRNILVKMS